MLWSCMRQTAGNTPIRVKRSRFSAHADWSRNKFQYIIVKGKRTTFNRFFWREYIIEGLVIDM